MSQPIVHCSSSPGDPDGPGSPGGPNGPGAPGTPVFTNEKR